MFEQFAHDARQAVVAAQQAARELKHDYVGTEHLLLGVLRVEGSAGERVLRSLDISFERTRDHALRILVRGETIVEDAIPFTPRARRVLELALGEAEELGSSEVGSEHIVLALMKENEGVAARLLLDFGANADTIRAAVGLLPPVPRPSRPDGLEPKISSQRDLPGMVDPVFEGQVDFGWRGRSIVLATLGAAALSRSTFHPRRTGGLSELEMQLLAYLTLEADRDHNGQRGPSIESLDVVLACDPDELDDLIQSLVDRRLLVYNVDDPEETRIALTHASVTAVENWLRLVIPLFPGWPTSYEGADDATG